MIEIEVVIVIAVALAAWLFVHFRKKMHNSEVESVVAQKVSKAPSEPEPVKVQKVVTNEVTNVVPEDSTLRRHYLQNLASIENSAKVDVSELEPVVEIDTAVVSAVMDAVPEDSTLRRHYLQNLASIENSAKVDVSELEPVVEIDTAVVSAVTDVISEVDVSEPEPVVQVDTTAVSAVTDVIPEDSTLRRHYLQNLASAATVAEPVINEEPALTSVAEDVPVQADVASVVSGTGIPEDAVLKRHFIQRITAETEAKMSSRPTDSTLKRHYDAQLLSAVNCQLDAVK